MILAKLNWQTELNRQNFGKGFELVLTVSERHPYPYPSEAPVSPMP